MNIKTSPLNNIRLATINASLFATINAGHRTRGHAGARRGPGGAGRPVLSAQRPAAEPDPGTGERDADLRGWKAGDI